MVFNHEPGYREVFHYQLARVRIVFELTPSSWKQHEEPAFTRTQTNNTQTNIKSFLYFTLYVKKRNIF